jgi:hypothetical protein
MKKKIGFFLSLTVLALSMALIGCPLEGPEDDLLDAPKVTLTNVSSTEITLSWTEVKGVNPVGGGGGGKIFINPNPPKKKTPSL